ARPRSLSGTSTTTTTAGTAAQGAGHQHLDSGRMSLTSSPHTPSGVGRDLDALDGVESSPRHLTPLPALAPALRCALDTSRLPAVKRSRAARKPSPPVGLQILVRRFGDLGQVPFPWLQGQSSGAWSA